MPKPADIPVLDVSPIFAADSKGYDALVREFARAYGETGFGYIVNHGIEPDLCDAVFTANRDFHAQSLAQKMEVELNATHRGYIRINTSTDVNSSLAEVTKPNQSESFMMMREDAVADPEVFLSGPNQWPDMPGFRGTLEAYTRAMSDLGNRLMQVALRAAGANPGDIMHAFETPTTWLRLLHYPPRPDHAPGDLYGSAPHRDFGCLTLLAQDPVGGLQVQTRDGAWVDAPFLPGSFVVNVGDMLHQMTNGRLLSTPHRVINQSGQERYSVPFFLDPHVSTNITPLPGTGAPEFEPILFGDFLRGELSASYEKHNTLIPGALRNL